MTTLHLHITPVDLERADASASPVDLAARRAVDPGWDVRCHGTHLTARRPGGPALRAPFPPALKSWLRRWLLGKTVTPSIFPLRFEAERSAA